LNYFAEVRLGIPGCGSSGLIIEIHGQVKVFWGVSGVSTCHQEFPGNASGFEIPGNRRTLPISLTGNARRALRDIRAGCTEIGGLVILLGGVWEFQEFNAARQAPGDWDLSTGYPQVYCI